MNAYNFLTSPVADALGWTLLHAIWQGFALVLPVAVLLHFLQNQSSVVRYRISALTLLIQLLVSGVTFIWYYHPVTPNQTLPSDSLVRYAAQIRWQTMPQPSSWHQPMWLFLENHLSQFVLIYLIGVALFGLRLLGGWIYLQRLSQTASHPATKSWIQLINKLRTSLAIQATVQIRESVRIAGPMVVGVIKPVLLLPVGMATQLSLREIEAVLAHELAHIKRQDYAVNLLQSVVEVLYFFHPALWWLSARVREEREHCCDDLAVQVCGGNGRVLAQALARVEELRLTYQQQTPTLAVAFASERQHLLHRIRRVLGVPTRPFISNGSLAGLTLATILFMSLSVYAVQQEPQKPNQPKPKSTQRFNGTTSGQKIGYTLSDGRLTIINVNGKRLPKAQVNQIQQQLDRVLTGQLDLDSISQPNRDILLTIFEKSAAFDVGMAALSKGMAQIDYNNIVANAMESVRALNYKTIIADAMQEVKGINYDSVVHSAMQEVKVVNINQAVHEAMAAVAYSEGVSDSLDRQRAYHQRKMDSLSQLIAQRSKQMQALHLQMEKLRFPVEEVERANEVLEWKKQKLMEQRRALIEKHQKLLYNNEKQKLSQAEVEKQLGALEPEIKKLEGSMDELNRQIDQSNAKQDDLKLPVEKLEREAEQLDNEIEKLSEQIGRQSDGMARLMPTGPMNVRVPRVPRPPRPMAPQRPMLAPTPPASVHPALPATPPVPGTPARRGQVHISPPKPPAPAATPKPKPAIAPKAERPE